MNGDTDSINERLYKRMKAKSRLCGANSSLRLDGRLDSHEEYQHHGVYEVIYTA